MSIDRDRALALTLPERAVTVELGALRAFARAIGEADPVRAHDTVVSAGDRSAIVRDANEAAAVPVPPTYLFSLELLADDSFAFLDALEIDLSTVLHGGQEFEYFVPVYAGDRLVLRPRIVDVEAKKGGRMELVTKQTDVLRGNQLVARLRAVLVVRRPAGAAA